MVFEHMLRLKRMREQVQDEMDGIPRRMGTNQSLLRQIYWSLRTHHLGRKTKTDHTKEESLAESIIFSTFSTVPFSSVMKSDFLIISSTSFSLSSSFGILSQCSAK